MENPTLVTHQDRMILQEIESMVVKGSKQILESHPGEGPDIVPIDLMKAYLADIMQLAETTKGLFTKELSLPMSKLVQLVILNPDSIQFIDSALTKAIYEVKGGLCSDCEKKETCNERSCP